MHKLLAVVVALILLGTAVAVAPLSAADGAKTSTTRWLKIRVYENDSATPTVLVNLPVRLVAAAVKVAAAAGALDHGRIHISSDGDRDLHLEDLDLQAILKEVETMEPGLIVEVKDGGDRVTIWVE
jgi:hypothetical protein